MFRAAISGLALAIGLAGPLAAQQASVASGVIVRTLDKVNGRTTDIEIPQGRVMRFGNLLVTLRECRYPRGNPSGDAYASLEIVETGRSGALFSGWMIASAPALNALEHPRYDVWVLRCKTS